MKIVDLKREDFEIVITGNPYGPILMTVTYKPTGLVVSGRGWSRMRLAEKLGKEIERKLKEAGVLEHGK